MSQLVKGQFGKPIMPAQNALAKLAEDTKAISALVGEIESKLLWIPNPGPQTMAYESVAHEVLFGGAAGCGKMLDLDTPVPIPSGWSTVGRLIVGSQLFTERGTVCRLTALYPIDLMPESYRLTFDDGSQIVACADHLWKTYTANDLGKLTRRTCAFRESRRVKRPVSIKTGHKSSVFTASLIMRNKTRRYQLKAAPVGTIWTTKQLAETLMIVGKTGRRRTNHAIQVCHPLELPDVELPIDPYVLGAWLGDGTSCCGGFTSADRPIREQIRAAGYRVGGGPRRHKYHWTIYGLKVKLRDCNVLGNKHVPNVYLRASCQQRLSLLQGLMDTDGYACKSGSVVFTNTNERLSQAVCELACSMGWKVTIAKDRSFLYGKECSPVWEVRWTPDLPVFRLPRKLLRQQTGKRWRINKFRYIVACERVESRPMRCLSVDNPTQLFLVGKSMIPTHNSSLAVGLSLTKHRRSLLLRRTAVECVELVDQLKRFAGDTASWRSLGYGGTMKTKDGRVIEVGGCEHEDDWRKYAGRPHDLICVSRGTPVLMADGRWKPIELVQVGELVASLEGDKQVVQKHPPQWKKSVRLDVFRPDGTILASQIQSCSHEVLSTAGWASHQMAFSSTDHDADRGSYAFGKATELRVACSLTGRLSPLGTFPSASIGGRVRHSLGDSKLSCLFLRELQDGETDRIPKYIARQTTYSHPYTKEIRQTRVVLKPFSFRFTPVGIREVYDLAIAEVNHYITNGGIVNKNCFDETVFFSRSQVRSIGAWNRHENPNQQCRILCPTNPPVNPEGRWIVEEFAPWLDSEYPNPAVAGEIRWYTVLSDDVGKSRLTWVDSGSPFEYNGERIVPRSRTFIPGRLSDNPILAATDYGARLQALPEPLRSRLLYGDFDAGIEDNAFQVIPTDWVRKAMARWKPDGGANTSQSCLGVDVAHGGLDQTIIAERRGTWFAKLKKYEGKDTPDGQTVATLVVKVHENNCPVNIDAIGYGASAYDQLKELKWFKTNPVNNAAGSGLRDRSGRFKFVNVRAASYWQLREALDPINGDGLALPPDNELQADLCAPTYKVQLGGIQVEKKEDIIKRIGRSPDAGDAVVLAHWEPLVKAGTVRVIRLSNDIPMGGKKEGRQPLRLVVCTRDELAALDVGGVPILLIEFRDPVIAGDSNCDIYETTAPCPPTNCLMKLLDHLTLEFIDDEPANLQNRWGEAIMPWNKKPVELVMHPDDGKRLWEFLRKKREPQPQLIILCDDQRRASSISLAMCDMMGLTRQQSIHRVSDDQWKADRKTQPENKHVYACTKSSRSLVSI